jgi:hypothetical protein
VFVGDLEAGVADGQVTPQVGQDLYYHLQQLLFAPPGQTPQQIQQQYDQLVQAYDQRSSQGQVTGHAATTLRHALAALGASQSGRSARAAHITSETAPKIVVTYRGCARTDTDCQAAGGADHRASPRDSGLPAPDRIRAADGPCRRHCCWHAGYPDLGVACL